MTKPLFLLSVLLCFFLNSCDEESTKQKQEHNELDRLEESIMALHDTLMSKMDALMTKESTIRYQLKRKKLKGETDTLRLISKQKELHAANKAMFDWMAGFKLNKVFSNMELRKQYLTLQKKGIIQVKVDMEKAMAE